MKIISWNVNGLRAAWNHGVSQFCNNFDGDIYAFQETRVSQPFVPAELKGYYPYWSFCQGKKGYSGTLILSKQKALGASYDMGNPEFDTEGRIITLEFPQYYFVNCYFPNSQHSALRHDYRVEWDSRLHDYLLSLEELKPVIICGDFNVPISDYDIYEESKWVELNAEGFQSVERENLLRLTREGFVDSYRHLHPQERGKFSWWSNRLNKRGENRGWRLDYFFVSCKISDLITESTLLSHVYGSDHCPILLELTMADSPKDLEEVSSSEDLPAGYTYSDLIQMEEDHIPYDQISTCDLAHIWNTVDWQAAEEHLQSLQMSLAKVAYSRDQSKISYWQKRIVSSLDAKLLAVRHVCSSGSGSGVDCVKWTTSDEKMSAALSLTADGYSAMPSRMLLITSKNGKQRRVHIETYYDRAMQTLYSFALDPVAESLGDRKSFAYRKGRSAYDLNEYIKLAFSGEDAPQWVVIGDVRKCYENISHHWIRTCIPMDSNMLDQFLNAGYILAGNLYPTSKGIGIGCTLSPIIANMALDGMQEYIFRRLYPHGNIDYNNGNLIRYADDLIIAAKSEESAKEICQILKQFLSARGLELSPEKTRIINIKSGFSFMSRTYQKLNGRLYVTPSVESVERFMNNIKDTIEGHNGSQEKLIARVNKKIDGWVTYHKVSEAGDAFRKVDVYIAALLLEACEKRHPKWSRERILQRYWYIDTDGSHRYALPDRKEICVKRLADTLLIDHVPIKTNFNPYIELDYMERRSHHRQISSVTGVYRSIWERQNGRCHYCGRIIFKDQEKVLTEIDAAGGRLARRMAYVHSRCVGSSLDYVDTDVLPDSITDVQALLTQLDSKKKIVGLRYLPLAEFFRTCDKSSITLTFKEIEEIIGTDLGTTADTKPFWYRTGFNTISQSWLDHGYEIKSLYLEGKQRVVFHLTSESKGTGSLVIPDVLRNQRIPSQAKYELENYFQYILKKYGL